MTRRRALWVTYAIYVTIGFLGAVIGPALGDLAAQVGSTEGAIGVLLTAIFLGAWIAQLSVGPLMDRFGPRPLMVAGLALALLGVLGILLSPTLAVLLAAGVVYGIGSGAIDTGSNVLIAQLYADDNVSVLNALHLFFGVGAVAAPAVAAQTLDWTDSALPAIWIGALMLLLLWPGMLHIPRRILRADAESGPGGGGAGAFSYRNLFLWGLGVVLLLYVSAEMGLSAWMTQYVHDSTPLSKAAGARITSLYWLALTLGRLAGIRWGRRYSGDSLMLISLLGAAAGAVVLAAGVGSAALTVLGAAVVGFFFGPVYPTVVALAAAAFRSGPGKAVSLVASLASLGGMVGPPLQGALLNEVSPLSSMVFILAQCVATALLYLALRRGRRAALATAGVALRPQG